MLVKGEPNISYICSRYYRAPELIFGATDYTTAIDVWSVGCVVAELLLGQPLFPGESGVDQLVEIIKVLGTPSREEIHAMNPNYTEFKFPQIKAHPWTKVFSKRMPPDAVDLVRLRWGRKGREGGRERAWAMPLAAQCSERCSFVHARGRRALSHAAPQVSKLLQYAPQKRMTAHQAMTHPFFDELREPGTKLPNGEQRGALPSHSGSRGTAGTWQSDARPPPGVPPLNVWRPWLPLPAGKPLPPLFNWLPGELDDTPADIVRKLQPKASGSPSS